MTPKKENVTLKDFNFFSVSGQIELQYHTCFEQTAIYACHHKGLTDNRKHRTIQSITIINFSAQRAKISA